MEIKTFGSRGVSCQVNAIDDGFRLLGHTIVKEGYVDFIYSNDSSHHEEAIKYQQENGGKIILNTLDLPPHMIENGQFNLDKAKETLDKANALTVISNTVSVQLKTYLGLDSKVIYNPAKEVGEIPGMYQGTNNLKFLMLGRVNDPNKNFNLVRQLMDKYFSQNQLVVVGSEDPKYGKYAGLVSDNHLNFYYNQCDFVLQPSSFEGMGLSPIESLICGKPVITLSKNPAAMEFTPEFCGDDNVDSMYAKIEDIINNEEYYKKTIKNYQSKYASQFHKVSVAQNIMNVFESL